MTDLLPDDALVTRRWTLTLTGGALAVGLAGCVGAPTNNSQSVVPADDGHIDEEPHDEPEEADAHYDGDHDEAIGAPADTAEVRMVTNDTGTHFEPHVVRVNVGGTVTWVNESGSHSTTAYHPEYGQPQLVPDGAAVWDSGLFTEAGATFEHTFEIAGVYHYYCIPHEARGMIGSVIVGEPDPHEEIAIETMPEDKPERVREKLTELNGMIRTVLGDEH